MINQFSRRPFLQGSFATVAAAVVTKVKAVAAVVLGIHGIAWPPYDDPTVEHLPLRVNAVGASTDDWTVSRAGEGNLIPSAGVLQPTDELAAYMTQLLNTRVDDLVVDAQVQRVISEQRVLFPSFPKRESA